MNIDQKDIDELIQLEESLWLPETRFDLEYMDKILAPDFFEFGRSGKVYQRQDTLNIPKQSINAKIPLKNIKVSKISDNAYHVTYISEVMENTVQIGNRSSIWLKTPQGWQLKFHQGTVVPK